MRRYLIVRRWVMTVSREDSKPEIPFTVNKKICEIYLQAMCRHFNSLSALDDVRLNKALRGLPITRRRAIERIRKGGRNVGQN